MCSPVRVAYYASHPIQYQAPLLRRVAAEPGVALKAFFGSDFSVRGYRDKRFGVQVKWDVPLLGGYQHEFLPVVRDDATTGIMRPLNRGFFSRLKRGVNGKPFDVLWVHGYSTVNSWHAMVAAKALGIPVMVRAESWQEDQTRGWGKRAAKRLFFAGLRHMVDGVLPIGSRNAEYWRRFLPGVPQFSVPYAVDNAWFQEQSLQAEARRDELRKELELEPETPVILFAAKLQRRKHCDDLIAAYVRLMEGRSAENVPYLVIVGDGEMRGALEEEAKGLKRVRFCGFRNQSEMPRFFDLATVFVLPSRNEPWGLIVNEAMNAGRAAIVSDEVGCQPDLVRDGLEGLVYPAGDVEALAGALMRVVSMPDEARRMGAAARARISSWSFEEDMAGLRKAIAALTGR